MVVILNDVSYISIFICHINLSLNVPMNNKSLANISNVLFLSSINIVIKKTFLVGKDTNNVRKHVLLINLSYDKEVI